MIGAGIALLGQLAASRYERSTRRLDRREERLAEIVDGLLLRVQSWHEQVLLATLARDEDDIRLAAGARVKIDMATLDHALQRLRYSSHDEELRRLAEEARTNVHFASVHAMLVSARPHGEHSEGNVRSAQDRLEVALDLIGSAVDRAHALLK